MKIFTSIIAVIFIYLIGKSIFNEKKWDHQHILTNLLNNKWSSTGRKPMTLPVKPNKNHSMVILILLLAGDIERNPGSRTKQQSIYPCGLCEHPVTWNREGACCDDSYIWHHRTSIELCSVDYDLLQTPNVQWLCCKCESFNVLTFPFHSYELNTSNYYDLLTHNSTFESITSNSFSPLKASSPKGNNSINNNTPKSNTSKTRTNSSKVFSIPKKQN
ncbi:unnamed protein product [Mytilus coruscus]|uniref:PHD-type domain-containing protein n=1 Tax=Mytilus coruscus TaxID=42192 RepID=A0A6J8BRG5_MYTCO|nr:unnamed protein product [Mytilus coruscus]